MQGAGSRSEHADSPRKAETQNGCDVIESQPAMPRFNANPAPRRIELCAGRERKENASVTQSGTRFPNGRPTETASQNIGSEWDAFSEWVVGGKFIPESKLGMGFIFRMAGSAETATRNLL